MTWLFGAIVVICLALTSAGPYEDWLFSVQDPSLLAGASLERRVQIDNYYRDYYTSYYRDLGVEGAGLVPPPLLPGEHPGSSPPRRAGSLLGRLRERLGLSRPSRRGPRTRRPPTPPQESPLERLLPPVDNSVPLNLAPPPQTVAVGPPRPPVQTRRVAVRTVVRPASSSAGSSSPARRIPSSPAVQQRPIPVQGTDKANLKVKACCEADDRIPPQCYNLCNFDNFNRRTLTQAYLRKTCPVSAAEPVISCASNNKDHTQCCRANGVRGICLNFCTPGIPADIGNHYLKCLRDLNTIKNCFRRYHNST